MIATAYLEIVPTYRHGKVTEARIIGASRGMPYGHRVAGTLFVQVKLDIDERLLTPRVLEGKVPPGAGTIVLEVQDAA